MPFLERRWRPHANTSLTFRGLISQAAVFLQFTVRHWPLTWALVYLAGFGLGGLAPGPGIQHSPLDGTLNYRLVARFGALTPAVLAYVPAGGILPVWLTVFAAGHAAGSLEARSREGRRTAMADHPHSVARFLEVSQTTVMRITGWPTVVRNDRWRAPARIVVLGEQKDPPAGDIPFPGQGVWLTGEGKPPTLGALITGPVRLTTPQAATVQGGFDFRKFLTGRGLTWQGRLSEWRYLPAQDTVSRLGSKVFTPLRANLVAGLSRLLPAEEAGMAAAVLLGIRTSDSRRASRPFSDLGLAHLFAVSGLHVGILLGIVMLPGQIAGLSPFQKILPLSLLLPLYVLLTGMPGSVVRAASLGFLALAMGSVGRSGQPLRLIGLLFWAGTIWDPSQNLDTGLKLSYLAAGGILAVSALTRGLKFSNHRIGSPIFTGLAVSAAAQWFTLPLVAGSFGRISLVSPLANLVAVPVFGLAVWCVVLALILANLWTPAALWVGSLAWLLFRSLAGLAALISQNSRGFPLGLPPPGEGSILIWAALSTGMMAALYLRLRSRLSGRRTLILVALALASGLWVFGPATWKLRAPARVTAWQFDVGQGDCALVVFPDGWTLMIDTGGRYGFRSAVQDGPVARNILPFLQRNGCRKIDAVVLTHGHLDHTGGTGALEAVVPVHRWYVSGRAAQAVPTGVDSTMVFRPVPGQVLHQWREWEVVAVYPPGKLPDDLHENNRSLVVVLRRSDQAMAVWSGDLEFEGERLMVAAGQAPRGAQVWKAGHHGSNTSGSRELLEIMAPGLVLVSCGVGNGYQHPSHGPYVVHGDTVPILRTDLQGTIRLEWNPDGGLEWDVMHP